MARSGLALGLLLAVPGLAGEYQVDPWPQSAQAQVIGDWPARWHYAGSLRLSHPERQRGGWSTLAALDTPGHFQAWSDRRGHWIRFALQIEQGQLRDLRVLGEGNNGLGNIEASARPGQYWLFGRDGDNRLHRYDADARHRTGTWSLPGYAPGRNSGIEALAAISDTRVMAIAEKDRPSSGAALQRQAWLISDNDVQAFSIALALPYHVTGLDRADDGHLYLLQRQYRQGTTDIAISQLQTNRVGLTGPNMVQRARLILHLRATPERRHSLDNYEGLAAFSYQGEDYLLLLADDNFDSQPPGRQHSLLYLLRQQK